VHDQVQQQHIRLDLLHKPQRFQAIAGLTHDGEAWFGSKQRFERFADDAMVVGQKDGSAFIHAD
jgi:hypothetical protein